MGSFGWAFIGAGGIAVSTAKKIFKDGRHRLVSVWNRTGRKADKLARAYGALSFASAKEAMTADGVDCVYIALTHDKHYEYAKAALELGKPVLVEKPLCVNFDEAKGLSDLAKLRGVYLCEAMWTWFSPAALKIEEIVKDGGLGEPQQADFSFRLPIAFNKRSRLLNPSAAGGALLDLGVYPITYAVKLFGMPKRINCNARVKYGVDLCDDVRLYYNGFTVRVLISVRSFGGEKLTLSGSRGTIIANKYHSGGTFVFRDGCGKKHRFRFKNARKAQFDCAAEEILAGKTQSEKMPLDLSLDAARLLDECRRQIGLKYPFEDELPKGN